MSRFLVYVVGPSGAGKDSVLGWVCKHLAATPAVHWAKRTITRAVSPGDEAHEAVDVAQFLALQDQGAFALSWQANGLHYGIRHAETAPLGRDHWVLVNGSRGSLETSRSRFPGLTVVHICASPDTLRQRLLARGREGPEMIEARILRTQRMPPLQAFEILNDGALDDAARLLLSHLRSLPGWPQ